MALLAPFAPAPFDAGRVILPLIGVAFSCTLVEALPISTYIDDNISVPLTAAIAVRESAAERMPLRQARSLLPL